jgi:hypothetical protein
MEKVWSDCVRARKCSSWVVYLKVDENKGFCFVSNFFGKFF